MEITILHQEEKPLLKRKEIQARIHFTGTTPSRAEIAKLCAQKLSHKRELLLVTQILTSFGDTTATVQCRAYSDEATMKKLERENLIEKNKFVAPEPEVASEPEEEADSDDSDEESSDKEENLA